MGYQAEGVLLIERQADLCVLKAGSSYKLADLLSILGHVIRFQWTVLLTLIYWQM